MNKENNQITCLNFAGDTFLTGGTDTILRLYSSK